MVSNSLNAIVNKYVKHSDLNHKTDQRITYLNQELKDTGISFRQIEEDDSFDYELILPTTISELNRYLGQDEMDQIFDGINMYFPPIPIIDILEDDALNAGLICVDEKSDNTIAVKCEHFGHAFGFLKFYSNNRFGKNQ